MSASVFLTLSVIFISVLYYFMFIAKPKNNDTDQKNEEDEP